MKKPHTHSRKLRARKVVCTVSASALMLGVSHAASVGLHFMENYCGSAAYSGYPVTMTAFGIPPSGWENLTEMNTGYGSCSGPLGYNLSETVSTNTSTGGLNPLPSGTLNIHWFGPTANFSGFGGYAGNPPNYNYGGPYPNPNTQPTGEEQVYATFIRDGLNFGPGSSGGDNNQPGYSVDITGLKSLFPNNPFVVELIASADSMNVLTNAFIIDVTGGTSNSVTYPNTPPVHVVGDTPWPRGQGGGLSTGSAALNTDHIQIVSNHPQHGGSGDTGFNNAGTISGFILTDKPVVSMSPRSVTGGPQDTVMLSAYAVGVPPLSYQWRHNGQAIPGATTTFITIPSLNTATSGNYDLVVTNSYGSATSSSASVSASPLSLVRGTNFVFDTNPTNALHTGIDNGATWLASSSDGTINRPGVMQFVATNNSGIEVSGTPDLNVAAGTVTFWMRSAGTVNNGSGRIGAAMFSRAGGGAFNDFAVIQMDAGTLLFNAPVNNGGNANQFASNGGVSDGNWHFVAVTFDSSAAGGAAIYIDGVLDSTNANSASWAWPNGSPVELGLSQDSTFRAYDGLLDDVRLYSRELTAAEIASIKNSGQIVDNNSLLMRLNFDTAPGIGFSVTWSLANVILQSATSAKGPYTDVGVSSSYYSTFQGTQRYFRYRGYTPQTRVSNPYLM